MLKRVLLFVATNVAVLLVLSVVTSVLGLDGFLAGAGIDVWALLGFAAVLGFGGALASLLLSTKWRTSRTATW